MQAKKQQIFAAGLFSEKSCSYLCGPKAPVSG
jgi:hypothetical protein